MFAGTADINGGDGPSMEVKATIPLPEHAEAEPDNISVRDIRDRIEGLFKAIGTDAVPETVFPPGPKNNGQQAVEFAISQQLKQLAEKRYERAKSEADASGVFGDKAKYVAGETSEVYRTSAFTISVQRNQDSNMIDRSQVETVLREAFPSKWKELLERCEKPKAGATRFIVALR
jgi:hypothetical protein